MVTPAACLGLLFAQHEHHVTPPADESPDIVGVEASRIVSGTAWQPAETPHDGIHANVGGWGLMFHGLLFGGYDGQGGDRGGEAAVGIGWVMGMATRSFSSTNLTFRTMLSPEPWTMPGNGYPLLLQTGETYQGERLHDRQHPHELFMEVAAMVTQRIVPGFALQLYAAPSGEPALGPVAFPHRYSASFDPMATLGHHWLDSTHISFGVLTAGLVTRYAKLEGSWFNGREPDETRTDFDLKQPDSWSARLWVAPTDRWAAQVSYGHLAQPEALEPDEPLDRVTASVTHHVPLGEERMVASTLVFGLNKHPGDHFEPAVVLESLFVLDEANAFFGRVEYVRKSGVDLVLAPPLDDAEYDIVSLVAGYGLSFGRVGPLMPSVGFRFAVDKLPASLESTYSSRYPVGVMGYVRLATASMH